MGEGIENRSPYRKAGKRVMRVRLTLRLGSYSGIASRFLVGEGQAEVRMCV